jgi:hypothetical protein
MVEFAPTMINLTAGSVNPKGRQASKILFAIVRCLGKAKSQAKAL